MDLGARADRERPTYEHTGVTHRLARESAWGAGDRCQDAEGQARTIEMYAERVEDATGRIVSKAKGLIDRVKSEVVGHAPIDIGAEPTIDDAPLAIRPRPAQTP